MGSMTGRKRCAALWQRTRMLSRCTGNRTQSHIHLIASAGDIAALYINRRHPVVPALCAPARQCTRTFSPLPSARSTKSKSGVTKAARFLSCCIQNDVGNLWAEHRSIEDRWSRKADRANSRSILYPWRISPPPPTTIPSPALEWADLK